MILTHLNLLVTYERLLKLLQVKSGFGTPASNIRHLETLNVEVSYQSLGTFEDLFDHLSQGRPCIAFIKTENFLIGKRMLTMQSLSLAWMTDISTSTTLPLPQPRSRLTETNLTWLGWSGKRNMGL
jgi:hypothetical protein